MSIVNISNVAILNNPAPFTTPLAFEITFECLSPLREDLEFKVTYVGSAESEQYDQLLESVMVGPVPVGVNKFVLEVCALVAFREFLGRKGWRAAAESY